MTAKEIAKLKKYLDNYAEITNSDGFYQDFIVWVYINWSNNNYFESKKLSDQGLSEITVDSGKKLSSVCQIYAEFINERTGKNVQSYTPDLGIYSETYDEVLDRLFYRRCYLKAQDYLEKKPIKYSPKKNDPPNALDKILFSHVQVDNDSFANRCAPITDGFARVPIALDPYMSPKFMDSYDFGYFGKWRLDDFRVAYEEIIKKTENKLTEHDLKYYYLYDINRKIAQTSSFA